MKQTLEEVTIIADAAMRMFDDGHYNTALTLMNKIDISLLSPTAVEIFNRTKQQLISYQTD